MAPTAQLFVRAVMQALSVETASDLTDALRLGAGAYGKVNRWVNGVSAPDFDATMLMLERTGWLNMEGKPPAVGGSDSFNAAAEIVRQLNEGVKLEPGLIELVADEMMAVAAEGVRVAGDLHRAARNARGDA